jgi:alginate O-acetyltransferase complex protein AlgI
LFRQIINILIVWSLTGFWHGASWNFILWGMYYGLVLIIEKVILLKVLKKAPSIICHLYSLLIIMLGWVLFYFEDMNTLGNFLTRLFSTQPNTPDSITIILSYLPTLLIGLFGATPIAKKIFANMQNSFAVRYGKILVTATLLLLCVAALANQSYNPFIYFRF